MLIRRCLVEDMPKLLEIWLQATLHAHDYLPAAAWWPRQEQLRQRLQATDDIWVVEAQADGAGEPSAKGPHPLSSEPGVVGFMAFGPAAAWLFAGLHGAGNGILTIAKGTLPLVMFGSAGYGERQGWLMVPARVAQAAAPYLFGLAIDRLQAGALWLTAGLGLAACAALLAWRVGPAPAPSGAPPAGSARQ